MLDVSWSSRQKKWVKKHRKQARELLRTLRVGSRVQYQGTWRGVIESPADTMVSIPSVQVRMTHDRRGNPLRKEELRTVYVHLLSILKDVP